MNGATPRESDVPVAHCPHCARDVLTHVHLDATGEPQRLCHDLMALDGYRNIEPLGGCKDKGRDAIHVDSSTGKVTIFAYSVRDDWRTKLDEETALIERSDADALSSADTLIELQASLDRGQTRRTETEKEAERAE